MQPLLVNKTHYIELNSAFRNRNEYPLPASYTTQLYKTATSNSTNALDPLCAAYPVLVFTLGSANRGPESFNGGTPEEPLLAPGASSQDDFYNGYSITDNNIAETRTIIGYDGSSHRVTLDTPFSNTWNAVDVYTISDQSTSTLVNVQSQGVTIDNFYINKYLKNENSGQYSRIVSYDAAGHTASVDPPFAPFALTDTFSIRGGVEITSGGVVAATDTAVSLALAASNIDGAYTGKFLYMRTGAASGQIRAIVSYVGAGRVATVYPAFGTAPLPGDVYEVLPFSGENAHAMIYSGSVPSQQESTLYEVRLVNLLLPNLPLQTGYGGRISLYPYIYVQLSNQNASGTRSLIYSNNPYSTTATFVVPIQNITNPNTSQFISLTCGMVQTMQFKPNDNLIFSVFLPGGEIFNTGPDNLPPLYPNPLIQVCVVFSIKRVEYKN